MNRESQLRDLRALVEFLETHEDCPIPYDLTNEDQWYVVTSEEALLDARRAIGFVQKMEDEGYIGFARHFGDLRYSVQIARSSICERKVVGKKIVPAKAAVEEHEEDVVEWVCPPSFLETFQEAVQ